MQKLCKQCGQQANTGRHTEPFRFLKAPLVYECPLHQDPMSPADFCGRVFIQLQHIKYKKLNALTLTTFCLACSVCWVWCKVYREGLHHEI